jgi:aspartate/methionine/tyrosine aminotransferase
LITNCFSNPNNPTGQIIKKSQLQELIKIAEKHDITILSDEVYRPIFHGISPADPEFPPSILSLGYAKTIATGSMSKAYSLAGIRVGWIASRNPDVIEACAYARDYTNISVSQLDEQVAAFALSESTVHSLLGRNIRLAKSNLEILERWLIRNDDVCEWVKPVAGTTCFVKFHRDGKLVNSEKLCRLFLEKTGVLFLPGKKCFGDEFEGYVRIGFVPETQVLQEGLDQLKVFMKKEFDDVPLAGEEA